MVKVPGDNRTNVIPKELVYVFSNPETDKGEKATHKTAIKPENIRDAVILLMETPWLFGSAMVLWLFISCVG